MNPSEIPQAPIGERKLPPKLRFAIQKIRKDLRLGFEPDIFILPMDKINPDDFQYFDFEGKNTAFCRYYFVKKGRSFGVEFGDISIQGSGVNSKLNTIGPALNNITNINLAADSIVRVEYQREENGEFECSLSIYTNDPDIIDT